MRVEDLVKCYENVLLARNVKTSKVNETVILKFNCVSFIHME